MDLEKLNLLKEAYDRYERTRVSRSGHVNAKTVMLNLLLTHAKDIVEGLVEAQKIKEELMEQIDALEALVKNQQEKMKALEEELRKKAAE